MVIVARPLDTATEYRTTDETAVFGGCSLAKGGRVLDRDGYWTLGQKRPLDGGNFQNLIHVNEAMFNLLLYGQ